MTRFSRSAIRWHIGVLALGLALLAPGGASGEDPPRKAAKGFRSGAEVEAFRALNPEERLKLVEKLAGTTEPFAAVRRGDLLAAIVERGSIESTDYVDVICKVKARGKGAPAATTINWVVDDGNVVKKGDVLARLDDSALRDELAAATLRVKVAEDALVKATENVRVVQRENAVEVRLTEINVKLVELELKDAPPGKTKEALELQVERAKLLHERAASRAKAHVARAEAEKRASEAAKALESERLSGVRAELQDCVLLAPADGIAMYYVPPSGRFGGAPLLIAPGESVREGQKLLRVTPMKQFALSLLVPESRVASLRVGQPAQIRVDAIPQKTLRGKVTRVSAAADPSAWAGTDTKVYPVTIAIDEPPPGLKPGMTGEVQVAIGERKNVLQVPRKAVVTLDGVQICYVKTGQRLDERTVVIGAGNAESLEIRDGLKEGEIVAAELIFSPRGGAKSKK